MRTLLTGATGFIGSHLAHYLNSKGWKVSCVGEDISKKRPDIPGQKIDVPWMDTPWQEIGQIDALIHHAAITDTSCSDKDKILKTNVYEPVAFFKAALQRSCSKIIYASSMQVYGNSPIPFREDTPVSPLNLYAKSKSILEKEVAKICQEHQDAALIGLRYGNVYGPGEDHKGKMASMVTQIGRQVLLKAPTLYKYGEQRRDFIYITDVLEAIHASTQFNESIVLNIGSGKGTSFNRIVELFNNEFGTDCKPTYIDNPCAATYQNDVVLDISLAEKMLSFKPKVSIEQGIHRYVASGTLQAESVS